MPIVTPLEKAFDRLLSLYLVSKANRQVSNFGNTKFQKFTFLAEWEMIDKREKGYSYFFLKFKKGPYSFDLANDIGTLMKAGIIRLVGYDIILTHYGKNIVNDFSNILDENRYLGSIIDKTIDTYAHCSLEELLNIMYSLPHPYVSGYTIGSATLRMPLLYKLPEDKVKIQVKLNNEQAENLLFNLGTNGLKHWQAVKDDMRNPECLTYKEVFGNW